MTVSPDSFAYKIIQVSGIGTLRAFDYLTAITTGNNYLPDAGSIGFCNSLKKDWMVFREEYIQLLSRKELNSVKDFYKVQTDLKEDDNWKAFPMVYFNYRFIENSNMCPQTFEAIKQIPGCTSAMFSVLGPGKYVPPHRGIYKGLFRCLLGLMVQNNGKCWIKINGKTIPFQEGECIVFDETAEHEVFNGTDQSRVVLYLDIYRKLPFPVNMLNYLIFNSFRKSPFIMNILKEYSKFDSVTFEKFIPKAPSIA